MRRFFFVGFFVFLTALTSRAQVQTGTYPHGAFDNKGLDTINIGNLNAKIIIPILSKPGRGLPFYYNLAYNSSIWTPASVSGSTSWIPSPNWGWTSQSDVVTGKLTAKTALAGTCHDANGIHGSTESVVAFYDFVYQDPLGASHPIGGTGTSFYAETGSAYPCTSGITVHGPFAPYHGSVTAKATDGSGYALKVWAGIPSPYFPILVSVTSPSGKVMTAPLNSLIGSGPGSYTDVNGNMVSIDGSGNFTDTTGNTVLTVAGGAPSPTTYTYTDTGGMSRTATMAYTSYSVHTAFGCSGVAEYGPVSTYLVSSITFADGTGYGFTYEQTPGYPSQVTGRLAAITTPEGGRINYRYTGGSNGIICADGGTATLTRSMPDDPLTPSVTYTRNPHCVGYATITCTELVDAMGNYGEYNFVSNPYDPNSTPFVYSYSQYHGGPTGTPLRQSDTIFNGATAFSSVSLPILSKKTTNTYDGTAVKTSTLTFNTNGLTTEDVETDYGSGSPGAILSDTQITYASLSNGIVNRPSSVTTYVPSGSSVVSVGCTLYGYDGNALTATSSLPQHVAVSGSRGNLTSVAGCTGGSTPVSITAAQHWYDDAGQLVATQDAALNQTTYAYDGGTDAFLTTVTYPTSGGMTRSTSSIWDVVRGVKIQDSNLNGNLTNYTYDLMLRPHTITGPGGFSQTYEYSLGPGAPQVGVATLHQVSGANITVTTYLDPYGRRIKMDTTDTPSDDLVAYSYDANGNPTSVSSPYRSGGAANYTTTNHDALGRPYLTTDSDGISQRSAFYSGNSTILTDEAGKQRKFSQTVWDESPKS